MEGEERTVSLLSQQDQPENSYDIITTARVATSSSSSSSITPLLLLSIFVALLAPFYNGWATGYSSPAESGIEEELDLSVAQFSFFGSIYTIGGLLGGLVNGLMADLIGRRGGLWCSAMSSILGWLAITFSKNAWWLDIGRLLVGFSGGILSYVVPVYIAETVPKDIRGQCISAIQLAQFLGMALVYVVGTIINWRTLALIGSIPCIVQVVGLFFIPESPRWLVKVGREEDFKASLGRLRGKNADIYQEAADIRDFTEVLERQTQSRILDLLKRRYARPIIIAVGLMTLQAFTGNIAIAFYASSIFQAAGFSSSIGTTAMAIISVPATGLGVFLIDRVGRRPLLMWSSGGVCLFCFLVGISFFFQDHQLVKEASPYLVLVGILADSIAYAVGVAGLPWVLVSEIFPINVKGSAGSLATSVSYISFWVVTYTYNFMAEWSLAGFKAPQHPFEHKRDFSFLLFLDTDTRTFSSSCITYTFWGQNVHTGTFFIYMGFAGAMLLFSVTLVPETRKRTLEEIQASMTHPV